MIQTWSLDTSQIPLLMDANITYAQVPGWLGRVTRDLKLSIIRPSVQNGPLPCLVWFCGGGWMDADCNVHIPNLVDFARAGFVVASVEYRDSNKAAFPAPLQDAKAAVRFLRAHADQWGIDPSRVAAAGESAGGHQASMLGVTAGIQEFETGAYLQTSSAVQAVVDYYGVVSPLTAKQGSATNDFDFVYRNLLGAEPEVAPDLVARANPETYLSAADEHNRPPYLILHGTADPVVPVEDSRAFHDQLNAHCFQAQMIEFPGAVHMDPVFWQPEVVQHVITFLQNALGVRASS